MNLLILAIIIVSVILIATIVFLAVKKSMNLQRWFRKADKFRERGESVKALKAYQKVIKRLEQRGNDLQKEEVRILSKSLSGCGLIFEKLGEKNNAYNYYKRY